MNDESRVKILNKLKKDKLIIQKYLEKTGKKYNARAFEEYDKKTNGSKK